MHLEHMGIAALDEPELDAAEGTEQGAVATAYLAVSSTCLVEACPPWQDAQEDIAAYLAYLAEACPVGSWEEVLPGSPTRLVVCTMARSAEEHSAGLEACPAELHSAEVCSAAAYPHGPSSWSAEELPEQGPAAGECSAEVGLAAHHRAEVHSWSR